MLRCDEDGDPVEGAETQRLWTVSLESRLRDPKP